MVDASKAVLTFDIPTDLTVVTVHRIRIWDFHQAVHANQRQQFADYRDDQDLPLAVVPGSEVGPVVATPSTAIHSLRMDRDVGYRHGGLTLFHSMTGFADPITHALR